MISKQRLEAYAKKINWGQHKSMPFSQGYAINEVIERYKIPAKAWGWDFDRIGVETNKQVMLWRDEGSHLSFLGLFDKMEV